MIVGIGIDQVEIDRMEGLLSRRPTRAAERLFTAGERGTCRGRARPAECFAARFAAKEAFLKALGTGLGRGVAWHEVEVVVPDGGGRPRLRLSGTAARRLREAGGGSVHLSFTHEAGAATAMVVLEG
jgi:holo-[acyl-carrier protein] synthase